MPYTPPTSRSPTSSISQSQPVSPRTTSRRHSPPTSPGPRPNLPRSRSQKLRDELASPPLASPPERAGIAARTVGLLAEKQAGSADKGTWPGDTIAKAQESLSEGLAAMATTHQTQTIRQDSSDEESYAELERAVRESLQLNGAGEALNGAPSNADMRASDGESTDSEASTSQVSKLSHSARKITHSRSSTEPAIPLAQELPPKGILNRQISSDGSEQDGDDEEWGLKPPLIRKKSGELVKPAIRPHMQMRRKHSSMPGTPTYGKKGVHFSDNITQVRHFLSVDRPMAVSAGGSPVESYEDELEFPFNGRQQPAISSGFEVRLSNLPRDTLERQSQCVRVDRIALSGDQKALLGDVVVANLSFHKFVTARFTTDSWQTTSEVVAAYNGDARKKPKEPGFDLFSFSINLTDQANLDKKTMLMCIRYNVGGQEFWDNNNSQNYRIEFSKKQQPAGQTLGRNQGPQSIPRSRKSSTQHHQLRTKPSLDDDFGNSFDPSPFRFRQAPKATIFNTPPAPRPQPGGQHFGSRYDFGASLTAALTHAQTQLGDQSGIKAAPKAPVASREATMQRAEPPRLSPARVARQAHNTSGTDSPKADGLLSNKPSVDSRAYQEFVSKFCFFGSNKASSPGSHPAPAHGPSRHHPSSNDGAQDDQPSVVDGGRTESSATIEPTSAPQLPTNVAASRSLTHHGPQFYGQNPNSIYATSPTPPPSSMNDFESRTASTTANGYPFGPRDRSNFFPAGTATPPAIRG